MKYAGAAYLLYMGFQLIRSAKQHQTNELDVKVGSFRKMFLRGLTANLLNPKVGVFYMAVLPQFIWVGAQTWLAGILLSLVHVVEGVVWLSVIILATNFARGFLSKPKSKMWIDRIAGSALIGFGLKTALEG